MAAEYKHLLGVYSLLAERDLYRAISVMTQDIDLHGVIQRTAPFYM